jgi:hypothetical protein
MNEENMHTIHNTTDAPMYVGLSGGSSVAIMPGESRPFPIQELAPAWRPTAATDTVAEAPAEGVVADPSLADHVASLQDASAKDIIDLVPDMETALLVAVGEAEQMRKDPRKTVLSAIAEEQLVRADREQVAAIAAGHIAGKAE